MTREVGSSISLPPARDVTVDTGIYEAEQQVVYMPQFDHYIELEYARSETNSWDVSDRLLAHPDFHPDGMYFVAIRGKSTSAGLRQFSEYTQYIYVDTTDKWMFEWYPISGRKLQTVYWQLSSGTMDIHKFIFFTCLPTVFGAGFDDLDTDADEESSVIGRIRYTVIPELVDVGACKLFIAENDVTGSRLYDEFGLVQMGKSSSGGTNSYGCDIDNGIIKVNVLLNCNDYEGDIVRIYHKRFSGATVDWVYTGQIQLWVWSNPLITDFQTYPALKIIKNTPEKIHILLERVEDGVASERLEFIIRRGDSHVEIKRNGIGTDFIMGGGGADSPAEFGWNGDMTTDPLRQGVVAGGLYAGAIWDEQFYLSDSTPTTNHYAYLWKMGQYAINWVTGNDVLKEQKAHSSSVFRTITELSGFLNPTVQSTIDPSVFFGSTVFSDWLRREAESADALTGTAAIEADANAYGTFRLKFTGVGSATYDLAAQEWQSKFPDGEYAIAVRAWYVGGVNASMNVVVTDEDAPAGMANMNPTVTTETFYGEEWFILESPSLIFAGATHYRIVVSRVDANAGDLYVDAIVLIPLKKLNNSKQCIRFPEGKYGLAECALKEAKQNPEYDKRR